MLQQIANDTGVDVDEEELNGRIALLAAQRARRPEKMKQDMAKDGSLANLYIQIREQKAFDKVLEDAQIEEIELKPDEEAPAAEAADGNKAKESDESSST